MRHFPVFVDLRGKMVVVVGSGEAALAKLRLLTRTEARLIVVGRGANPAIRDLAREGRVTLIDRDFVAADAGGASLLYAATGEDDADRAVLAAGRAAGVLTNVVDLLEGSDFITPAIVDRDPVTVAIGTEGAAPVLARAIKSDVEAALPPTLGLLARIGQAFRPRAGVLPQGPLRRSFWSRFYFRDGPIALAEGGMDAACAALEALLAETRGTGAAPGFVHLVGAGPGDPDLLTLRARQLLHDADVVVHDRLVPRPILDLARREARIVAAGKEGFGAAWAQADINALMIEAARGGAQVVRLKSGDPLIFARAEEEMQALEAAGIGFAVVPGITAAAAAAAGLRAPLTARGRNSSLRLLTAHDMEGFAEHDWQALARPGAVAAIYMGSRAAAFLRGRLLMFGAAPETPVSAVENASRPDQRVIAATLTTLPEALAAASPSGPVVLLLGLAPRSAAVAAAGLAKQAR